MMDSGSKREAQGSASGVSRRSERGLRPVNRYSPDEKGTPEVPKVRWESMHLAHDSRHEGDAPAR